MGVKNEIPSEISYTYTKLGEVLHMIIINTTRDSECEELLKRNRLNYKRKNYDSGHHKL